MGNKSQSQFKVVIRIGEFQARKFLLTIQSAKEKGFTHETIKDICQSLNASYFCMADEKATTGTEHTHVFIYRKTGIRERTIRKKFPSVHFDVCYGSCRENRDYVSKSGKWAEDCKAETKIDGSFEEHGEMPEERTEDNPDKADLITLVESGASTAEIVRSDPKYAFKTNDINVLRETLLSEKYLREQRDIEVIYLFGLTGTGKTRSIFAENDPADICRVTNYNRMSGIKFDSYHGQSILVFEEFSSQIPIHDMLNYLDRYPVMLPARYADRVACYTKVYITSNIPLEEQYTFYQENEPAVWAAFKRRITRIVEMTSSGPVEILNDVDFSSDTKNDFPF